MTNDEMTMSAAPWWKHGLVWLVIAGPAILEQMDATTVVNPGDRADCDPHGNIIITVGMLQ